MLLSPRLQKLCIDSLVVCHWMVFLKTRPFVKRNNTEFTNVSNFTLLLMCSTHFTLSCRILLFSLLTTNIFFKFVYSEITGQSAWWVLFRPPSLAIEGHQNLTHFNSGLLISRTFLPHARSSCTLLCLNFVSCTQKMCWRAHSLADKVPLFFTILQFSSQPSNNWGTGLSCLRPLSIYCTGQQYKASLFPCLFSCLSSFVSNCCIMDRTYHSRRSCPSTLALLRHHSFGMLASPFEALAFPF